MKIKAGPRMKIPKAPKPTPIVNDMHFTDAHAVQQMSTFNPAAKAMPLPKGAPKYVQPAGIRPIAKGLTNKRIVSNI